jgi:hypothetical protein
MSYQPFCTPCSNISLKPGEKSQQKTDHLISESMLLWPVVKQCCKVFARFGSRQCQIIVCAFATPLFSVPGSL